MFAVSRRAHQNQMARESACEHILLRETRRENLAIRTSVAVIGDVDQPVGRLEAIGARDTLVIVEHAPARTDLATPAG